jgi:hypothetical protein
MPASLSGTAFLPLLANAAPEHGQGYEQLSRSASRGIEHYIGYRRASSWDERLMEFVE